MIFWPEELFFDFSASSDLDNFDWFIQILCIFISIS